MWVWLNKWSEYPLHFSGVGAILFSACVVYSIVHAYLLYHCTYNCYSVLCVSMQGNVLFIHCSEDPTVSLEQINFQQFVCVLAKFRKLKSQKVEETSYNTLEQKIECEYILDLL